METDNSSEVRRKHCQELLSSKTEQIPAYLKVSRKSVSPASSRSIEPLNETLLVEVVEQNIVSKLKQTPRKGGDYGAKVGEWKHGGQKEWGGNWNKHPANQERGGNVQTEKTS